MDLPDRCEYRNPAAQPLVHAARNCISHEGTGIGGWGVGRIYQILKGKQHGVRIPKSIRWILTGIIEDDSTWILDGVEKLKDLVKGEPVTEADKDFAQNLLSELVDLE